MQTVDQPLTYQENLLTKDPLLTDTIKDMHQMTAFQRRNQMREEIEEMDTQDGL